MSQVTVHYERKFSDGNYGSEGLSVSWNWDDDDDEGVPIESIEATAVFLRRTVLGQLARSAARSVAWAAKQELTPPPEPVATPVIPGDSEDVEDLPF